MSEPGTFQEQVRSSTAWANSEWHKNAVNVNWIMYFTKKIKKEVWNQNCNTNYELHNHTCKCNRHVSHRIPICVGGGRVDQPVIRLLVMGSGACSPVPMSLHHHCVVTVQIWYDSKKQYFPFRIFNGFLNQVLSNGQEPIMGHVNILPPDRTWGWKSLKINIVRVSGHYYMQAVRRGCY
jgi:hypothetical protein